MRRSRPKKLYRVRECLARRDLRLCEMSIPHVPSCHRGRVRMLYKAIQRLHRGLPVELCELGSAYTRDEFKRHKNCNQEESSIFMTEWTQYAITLTRQLGLKGVKLSSPVGCAISEDKLEDFRDDQIAQLYELMLATSPRGDEANGPRNSDSKSK